MLNSENDLQESYCKGYKYLYTSYEIKTTITKISFPGF